MNETAKTNFMYCNQVGVITSAWDILIALQRVAIASGFKANDKTSATTPTTSIEEEIHVAMSPGHAKIFLAALYSQIESYEKHAGKEITLDPENQKKFDTFINSVKAR